MQRKAKIAIIHDAFLYRGGGERLVTLMAEALDADLISGFFSEGSFDPRKLGFRGKMISLGRPVFMKGLRHLILKNRFISKASMLREYDIVIFSGNCLDALRHVRKDAKTYYYCHTPPRYLFDFRESYLEKFPPLIRPIARRIFDMQADTYIRQLERFDTIFTNSRNTHDRLLHYCGYESDILYPPTDVEKFKMTNEKGQMIIPKDLESRIGNLKSKNYFFSFARLSPPKRIDIIVDAFLEMPDRHLVFTYGSNDPMKEEILFRIRDAKNITAIPAPEKDSDLIALIVGAIATIYIPIDEDFGMSPVESMACGTPVIGADEGGLRETVIVGKTGVLIEVKTHELGIIALKDAVEKITPLAPKMRTACINRAKKFSLQTFIDKLYDHLD